LNPIFRVGDQISEAIRIHQGVPKRTARDQAVEMLRRVGIPDPESGIKEYPHQMSGGMRQRVMFFSSPMTWGSSPRWPKPWP